MLACQTGSQNTTQTIFDADTNVFGPEFPWPGEELYYKVEVTGFDALRTGLIAGHETEQDGITYIPVSGSAISYGFFSKIYPVEDTGDSFIEPGTLFPFVANKQLNEAGKHKLYSVTFQRDRFSGQVTKEKEGKTTTKTVPLPADTYDALSWAYTVRRIPLEEGFTHSWIVYDGWKIRRIQITVGKKDRTWCPMGWFDTVELKAQSEVLDTKRVVGAIGGSPLEPLIEVKKGPTPAGQIWLTDDDERRPIRVKFKVKIGEVNLLLADYTPPDN